jgi:hypothetical protein
VFSVRYAVNCKCYYNSLVLSMNLSTGSIKILGSGLRGPRVYSSN